MGEFQVDISQVPGDGTSGEVRFRGDMTVMNACQARDALLQVFSAERITVDVTTIAEIDLSGLQLLCAAHRAALEGKKTLVLSGIDNEAFVGAARAAGMFRHMGCQRDEKNTCIWVGGS